MKNKYKTNSDLETQEIGKIFSKEIKRYWTGGKVYKIKHVPLAMD